MHAWLNYHLHACRQVWQQLLKHWLNTLMIWLVIGVTVTLPGLLFAGLENLQSATGLLKDNAQISVFLKSDLPTTRIQRLISDIQALPGVTEVRFVPKEEALRQLSTQFSQPNLLETLPQNPLPDAVFITLQDVQPAIRQPVQEALQSRAEVDELVIDSLWLSRLQQMLTLGKQIAWIVSTLLAVAMLLVISNTVRMQVLTHQAEIEVSKLIGATAGFIRRPFLYMGSIYGAGGGIIACIILYSVFRTLSASVNSLASHYQSAFSLQFPWLQVGGGMVLGSVLVGWLAAWIAVRQHIARHP